MPSQAFPRENWNFTIETAIRVIYARDDKRIGDGRKFRYRPKPCRDLPSPRKKAVERVQRLEARLARGIAQSAVTRTRLVRLLSGFSSCGEAPAVGHPSCGAGALRDARRYCRSPICLPTRQSGRRFLRGTWGRRVDHTRFRLPSLGRGRLFLDFCALRVHLPRLAPAEPEARRGS